MNKLIRKKTHHFLKKFKFYWFLFTLIILSLCLIFNWYIGITLHTKSLSHHARIISNNLDNFIENILQEMYTLPIYNKNKHHCLKIIYPILQRITLNQPKISGLIITDTKNQLICSNLPSNTTIVSTKNNYGRSLTGPFELALFDKPVYLLQQKIGDYQLGIVMLSSVLEDILQTHDKTTDSIVLYNQLENRNMLGIKHIDNNTKWSIDNHISTLNSVNKELTGYEKLTSIRGLEIVVLENHSTFLYSLWFYQALLIILTLLISYIFYYIVKSSSNNQYSFHGILKKAIKNNEFFPVYQPIFDNVNKKFAGAEILLRWQDNQDEIILPDFFIAEAENSGLIIPITLQITEMVFQETASILKTHPEFLLSLNISTSHFTDKLFFKTFYEQIEKYNISPHNIIIEITERDLLDKNDIALIAKMTELIQLGYSLAIDDFGTGHATISYIQHFPFNYLKIDKIFVQAIGTKAITESLINTIISMATDLNLIIIAEGVESIEQYHYLAENNVQFLQGWYFSRDLPIEQLKDLLEGKLNAELP